MFVIFDDLQIVMPFFNILNVLWYMIPIYKVNNYYAFNYHFCVVNILIFILLCY